jgi:ABC-type transporter MlaC component
MKRQAAITPVRLILVAALLVVGVVLWTSLRRGQYTHRWLESCEPVAPATLSPPPTGSSPMADLGKANAALQRALANPSPAEYAKTKGILRDFFDVEEFARRALARHCAGINPERRDEFVGMLREVLVRMLDKDIHDHRDYDLQFTRETITGSEAAVEATLDVPSDGKKTMVALDYKLLYKDGRWLVYDVTVDKQSMIKNYEAEFDKIITKESFDVVFRKTKQRFEKNE